MSALQGCACQVSYAPHALRKVSAVQRIADWRREQGRASHPEDLGAEADNERESSEEEDDGNRFKDSLTASC